MKLKQLIEASLFISTKPISLEDLCSVTECSSKSQVQSAIDLLINEYEQNNGALEIRKVADDKYAMQVKKEYTAKVSNLIELAVSDDVLKTLSYIALRQPITQAEVVKARGYVAYDHVKELTNKEFIFAEPKGRTKELTTTPNFSEYFGLESKDPVKIRSQLEKTMREL